MNYSYFIKIVFICACILFVLAGKEKVNYRFLLFLIDFFCLVEIKISK